MSFLEQTKQIQLKEGFQFSQQELEELPNETRQEVAKCLEWKGHGFDLRTHIVHPKSGILLKYQPYRRHCSAEHGVIYYRRDDKGVERRYNEQGQLLDKMSEVKEIKQDESIRNKAVSK